MAFRLVFETGSLEGKSFPVPEGSGVLVGRSHSCGVRPKEPDVSGRHLAVRDDGGVLRLEVFSSHKTTLDGARLSAGMVKSLQEGSRVGLGDALRFRVEVIRGEDGDTSEMPTGVDEPQTGTAPALGTGTFATAAGATGTIGTIGTFAGGATGTFATMAGGATGTFATVAGDGATGTFATVATVAAPTSGASSSAATGTATIEEGETGFAPMPRGLAGGGGATGIADDGETDSSVSEGGETQMLETQIAAPEEIAMRRGAHDRRQKRRVIGRALFFAIALAAVVGLYAWLSRVTVNPYLLAPVISFDGVIEAFGGKVSVVVPQWNNGAFLSADAHCVRWNSRLGDEWAVPYTIVLTNWTDRASLYETRESTFGRWRHENMKGLWRDLGEMPEHRFLGGEGGAYPGVPCIQHRYSRSDANGDNFAGTATFFRVADRCYVLLRELPADEEGRGYVWLDEVWSTLFARAALPDGSENLLAACHWEGTPEIDPGLDPVLAVNESRKAVESGSTAAWGDSERMLRLALREIHGRDDPDSAALRATALDVLRQLRAAQRNFWHRQCLAALKSSDPSVPDGDRKLEAIRRATEAAFTSKDDERHWLLGRPQWWLSQPEGF